MALRWSYSDELSHFSGSLERIVHAKEVLEDNYPRYKEAHRKRWKYKQKSLHADRQLQYWTRKVRRYKPQRFSNALVNFVDRNEEDWMMTGEEAYIYCYDRQGWWLDDRRHWDRLLDQATEELQEYSRIDFRYREILMAREDAAVALGWTVGRREIPEPRQHLVMENVPDPRVYPQMYPNVPSYESYHYPQ